MRANQEDLDLGPPPADPHEHAMWVEERRAAVELLAELANRDPDALRRASIGEWVRSASRGLLLDAAQECP
jgi:anti-sigma factor RsiW